MATLTSRTSKVGKAARGRTAAAETPLVFRGDQRLDDPARIRARAKLGRALASMAPRIERLTVRFEDVNGPRGGVDTRCRMKAVVSGAPSLVIVQNGNDPEEALARATPRLRRALRDLFDRGGGRMPAPLRVAAPPPKRLAQGASVPSTTMRNRRRPNRRMTVALEDSQGKPSRKSTRRSVNRARGGNKKTRRQRSRAATPRARHRKGK
jgi:hypothetical protein